MPKERKKRLKRGAAAATIIFVSLATWIILDRSEQRPDWLMVEAPEAAIVGQSLELRVTLNPTVEATRVGCYLQRAGVDRRVRRFLATSGPGREAAGGETVSFVFEIPERENMVFFAALIYTSPTGRWQERTRVASTGLLPVQRGSAPAPNPVLRRIRLTSNAVPGESASAREEKERLRRPPPAWVHRALSLLLIATAALCWAVGFRKSAGRRPGEMTERAIWLAFGAVLAFSALIELTGIAGRFADWARELAWDRNLYETRHAYQKAIMAVMAAAALGLFFLFMKAVRRPGSHRWLWWAGIGLSVYFSISFASVLSFHAVDVVRSMTWHGLSPIDSVRSAGALVAFFAAASALRRKPEAPPS